MKLIKKGIVVWFTGLPCSGKTTLSKELNLKLHSKGFSSSTLDGDEIRKKLWNDLGFSKEDRIENIRRVGEVSKLIAKAGSIAIVALVSPFRLSRKNVRDSLESNQFIEVYLECKLEECEKRDVKGMYAKAKNGKIKNFTGISSEYEPPINPEIHLKTDAQSIKQSIDIVFSRVMKCLVKNGKLG